MSQTFIVTISWPSETPIKASDVKRAIARYIQAEDDEAERYGFELAGYSIEVEVPSHARS